MDTRLCVCGHTRHWHGAAVRYGVLVVQGAGSCEYDATCDCREFVPAKEVDGEVIDMEPP